MTAPMAIAYMARSSRVRNSAMWSMSDICPSWTGRAFVVRDVKMAISQVYGAVPLRGSVPGRSVAGLRRCGPGCRTRARRSARCRARGPPRSSASDPRSAGSRRRRKRRHGQVGLVGMERSVHPTSWGRRGTGSGRRCRWPCEPRSSKPDDPVAFSWRIMLPSLRAASGKPLRTQHDQGDDQDQEDLLTTEVHHGTNVTAVAALPRRCGPGRSRSAPFRLPAGPRRGRRGGTSAPGRSRPPSAKALSRRRPR